jgi:CheY-like chemotaxis protein
MFTKPPESAASAPLRPLRVLVVDDVALSRDVAAAFLRECGHVVDCAEGGAEGVAAASRTAYDVILMDLRMPEVDGFAATRCIRAIDGPMGHVRIVALTAHAFPEQIAQCHEAGMVGHLAKPFTQARLQAAVMAAAEGDGCFEGARGICDGAAAKEESVFFFEEKHQKTFAL